MAVIVRGTIPAAEFTLHHALETVPGVQFEVERIIKSGEDAVLPLLWARGSDRESIEAAIREDPTVRDVTLLGAFDEEYLFRMEWFERIRLLLEMITNAKATILDAFGRNDRWQLRVLYPNHDMISNIHDFCDDHGLTFDIDSIYEMDAEPAGRYGLTEEQYKTLVLAIERGYFEVPRQVTLEALADEVGVSHQALSERLRRGINALLKNTLLLGAFSEDRPDERTDG